MPAIMPVFVPVRHTQECILVEGKKYCESTDRSPKEIGASILLFVFIAFYVLFLGWLAFEEDKPLLAGLLCFGPLLIIGIILLIS